MAVVEALELRSSSVSAIVIFYCSKTVSWGDVCGLLLFPVAGAIRHSRKLRGEVSNVGLIQDLEKAVRRLAMHLTLVSVHAWIKARLVRKGRSRQQG